MDRDGYIIFHISYQEKGVYIIDLQKFTLERQIFNLKN
jgi:hypothetical protein